MSTDSRTSRWASQVDPLVGSLALLTAVSEVGDAISYLGLGHVFVANMTGCSWAPWKAAVSLDALPSTGPVGFAGFDCATQSGARIPAHAVPALLRIAAR